MPHCHQAERLKQHRVTALVADEPLSHGAARARID
jgi:hypothetical protein